ncbi:conserved hypothetical protein [Histoplasma capsulatum G186AR]|uniref:Uncharacterized protein n=1 Tax=Ajellomyces capsulatus (strain G186AR / H82 / ATCC MYA-2454 / RMSCC 2432) TaxID=447093 RepID=C0NCS2_AJECG|nr:uncharacterized protein HCBG_00918 [Histoplasma capsulatum G186AR]EEH11463.1 conserved hypothetical protein [Histoplasma capsulatum G186AR]QSS71906.1 hypothetical protein I7I50_02923 [Histoplasma capsulatum G186AR]
MEQQKEGGCCKPSWYFTDPDQREFSAVLKNLKLDSTLQGCVALGKDGVLRSLTADRDVVDAVGLTPNLIAACLRRMPSEMARKAEYDGIDGSKVSRELWFNPDKAILPPPLSQEKRDEFERRHSEPEKP